MKSKLRIMFKLTSFYLVVLSILVSCSKKETCIVTEKDGVKHYQNKSASNPDLKLVIDNKLVINGDSEDSLKVFSSASDLGIDKDGNFYVFDYRKQKVLKYDDKGNFILSFCGKGSGPGEIGGAQDIAIVGDSLTLCSPGQAKALIFDFNGNFGEHKTVKIPGLYYGVVDMGISENEILGFNPTIKSEDNGTFIGNELVIKNKKYEVQTVLHTIPTDRDPKDIEASKIIFMPFSYSNGLVYFAPNFPEKYQINIKDKKGSLKSVISKFSRKMAYNSAEKEHYKESASFSWNGERIYPNCKFKSIINKIYTDKYGNLLVWASKERKEGIKHNPSIDIFKEGRYLNTIELDVIKLVEAHTSTDEFFRFVGDKLIVFDLVKNTLSIYDYHYENI